MGGGGGRNALLLIVFQIAMIQNFNFFLNILKFENF